MSSIDRHPRATGLPGRWRIRFALALLIIASVSEQARPAQQDARWIGGTGNWNTAANWDPAVVPNNGVDTYHARIDDEDTKSASVVTLDLNATIDHLTIDPGDELRIPNGRLFTLIGGESTGLLHNAGILRLESTASSTDLRLSTGLVTLTGGGVLILSDHASNRILGVSGGSLQILNQIVRGAGQIGVNSTALTNQGTIIADQPTALSIDPSSSPMINTGILRAQSGGRLRLINGEFENTGGQIEALTDSIVELSQATIRGGSLSTFDTGRVHVTSTSTLDGVSQTVQSAGIVEISNAVVLNLRGSIHNTGTLQLNSTSSSTELRTTDATVTLSGGGIVQMGNHANNRILTSGSGALVNVDNTIQGGGQIGVNILSLTNQGLIVADQSTALIVDPPASPIVNSGTMRADSGGTLRLTNGAFDNFGGQIQSFNASIVEIASATIRGGTLTSPDPGGIRFSGTSTLDGSAEAVTLAGGIAQLNGAILNLQGEIHNLLNLNIESTGTLTDLRAASGGATLTGGGVVNLSNSISNRILSSGGSLVNMDNTIRGSGQIGVNLTDVTNHGMIVADQSATLTIDPAANPFVNRGMLIAQLGATLRLINGSFDNKGGVIQAQTSSLVELNGAILLGGTTSSIGTGLVRGIGQNTIDGSTNILSNEGFLEVANGSDLTVRGQIHNTGTIRLASTGSLTDFEPTGGQVTLTGGGQITLSNAANNRILAVSGGSLLNTDNTITGSGQLGFNLTPIINQGTIQASQSVALTINPDNTLGLDNQGLLHATNSATMNIADGPFVTSGSITVDPASTFARTGGVIQTAGTTTVRGTFNATGTFDLQGGTLQGDGIVQAAVISAATVAPGMSTGILTFSGNYAQSADGVLAIEIGGTTPGPGHDRLVVSGTATLDGTISTAFVNGFVPTIGQTFTVMTYSSRIGDFAARDIPCPPGFGVAVNVLATSVVVEIVAPAAGPGDMNCDCVVSHNDIEPFLLALLNPDAYETTFDDCDIHRADLNMDTAIDALDIQGFVDLLLP